VKCKSFTCRRLRVLVMSLAFVGVLTCAGARVTRAQAFGSIERDRAQVMLSSVKSEIKKSYYDPAYHGMDVEAHFKAAEEKLKQAASMGQVFGIIAQVLLDLNDSHTFFIPPQRAVSVEYGWEMAMIGDKCYVVAIRPGSDAATKLKLGDEVLAIDEHQPTRENLWKMKYLYHVLRPQPGMNVVLQSPGEQPRQLNVLAKVKEGKRRIDLTLNNNTNDLFDLIREEENEARLHAHRYIAIGENKELFIWKMPQFDSPDAVDEMMGKAKDSKALVLDLRGNGGGAETALLRLLGYFVDKDVKVGDIKGRKETKPLIAKTRGGDVYKGKLIVLVDSESGSSAEIFARMVQLEKRGTVVGDNTAGAVMRAMAHPLQLGADTVVLYGVQVTVADLLMPDGKSLEGTGVTPDERRLPTAADMAANLDPVLAYAASLADVKLEPEKAGALFPIKWRN
jgi:C-terminal processing protease CtpA/Prc